MLMKPAPIFEAVREISDQADTKPYVVFFSPVGRPYSQVIALKSLLKRAHSVCLRVVMRAWMSATQPDDVISMGDYVLTGGELPALPITPVVRLFPGALGDDELAG